MVANDCDGHGTHVAGTAAGLQVGIAKDASIVSVRMLDCSGSGTISNTVAALDWVAANAKKPAVVTLSLGIQVGSWSRVLEDAVRSLVTNHGVIVVVASGNSAVDACNVAPANVPEAITVAATAVDPQPGQSPNQSGQNSSNSNDSNNNTTLDSQSGTNVDTSAGMTPMEPIYRWSNTGPCVDLFAPGVDVYSACGGASRCAVVDNSSYTYASGTSMAVPLVAGVAALYLEQAPLATPQVVAAAVTGEATLGVIDPLEFQQGTPNRLVFSKLNVTTSTTSPSGSNATQHSVAAANGP